MCLFFDYTDANFELPGEKNKTSIFALLVFYSNGIAGGVVLETKTTSLARHYEKDFGAAPLPVFGASAPRYLIADEAAKRIFFIYLV